LLLRGVFKLDYFTFAITTNAAKFSYENTRLKNFMYFLAVEKLTSYCSKLVASGHIAAAP